MRTKESRPSTTEVIQQSIEAQDRQTARIERAIRRTTGTGVDFET